MIPPYISDRERSERLHQMLASEICRIIEDLELREAFLIDMWSRHRDRGPFVDTLFSRWTTLPFTHLALLEPDTLLKCEEFYRELEEFKLYLSFTEAMPATMAESYRFQLKRLAAYAEQAVEALGGPPERPVIEFPDDDEDESPPQSPDEEEHPLLQLEHFRKDGEAPEGEE